MPVIITFLTKMQGGVFEWPTLGLILWPSWPIAAAGDVKASPDPFIANLFLLASIVINTVIYSGIGSGLHWLFEVDS